MKRQGFVNAAIISPMFPSERETSLGNTKNKVSFDQDFDCGLVMQFLNSFYALIYLFNFYLFNFEFNFFFFFLKKGICDTTLTAHKNIFKRIFLFYDNNNKQWNT